MTFETDQSRAAENRAHRLTDADCHEWGDDIYEGPEMPEEAKPLVWFVVVFVCLVAGWAVV